MRQEVRHDMDTLRLNLIKGDVLGIEQALKAGTSPDHHLREDWNLLMYASSLGHSDIVKLLLERGANPNCSKETFTPLMAACASRREEGCLLQCAHHVIQHGGDVDAYDRYRVTALMYAAREGHSRIVSYLLSVGANLRIRDERGWTALFWAVNGEKRATALLLIQAEAAVYRLKDCRISDELFFSDFQVKQNGVLSKVNKSAKILDDHGSVTSSVLKIQLCAMLEALVEFEGLLRCHYMNLDKILTSLRRLEIIRPSRVWPSTLHRVPLITREALCASERIYQQMRFLHNVAERVIGFNNVASGDFIVGKKYSPLEAWLTFIVTSTIFTVGLWHVIGRPHIHFSGLVEF